MLEADITIERSLATVWEYFTNHKNWEKWWGGGLKSAQWREGGKLVWALGGASEVLEIIPRRRVVTRGSWMDTKWEFLAFGPNETRVSVQSAPRGGASFSDGGAAHLNEMRQSLRRLKDCIERETSNSVANSSSGKKDSTAKRWWEFWKQD